MKKYVCSTSPSLVFLPKAKFETVLEFLVDRFPQVSKDLWLDRMSRGKVSFQDGELVDETTAYRWECKLQYFREVEEEKEIPFHETVLYEDEHIIIADKPHFLPVHPAGQFIEQTLLSRLQKKLDLPELVCAHRLDRMTAGLIILCKKEKTRALYNQLFQDCAIKKTYEAIGLTPESGEKSWLIQNRLVESDPWFLMKASDQGKVNSESFIEIIDERDGLAKFRLEPKTGKKHQLRVHMLCLGSAILNDLFYPKLYPAGEDDYDKPMQLLARRLEFIDPVTGEERQFESQLSLLW